MTPLLTLMIGILPAQANPDQLLAPCPLLEVVESISTTSQTVRLISVADTFLDMLIKLSSSSGVLEAGIDLP